MDRFGLPDWLQEYTTKWQMRALNGEIIQIRFLPSWFRDLQPEEARDLRKKLPMTILNLAIAEEAYQKLCTLYLDLEEKITQKRIDLAELQNSRIATEGELLAQGPNDADLACSDEARQALARDLIDLDDKAMNIREEINQLRIQQRKICCEQETLLASIAHLEEAIELMRWQLQDYDEEQSSKLDMTASLFEEF